MSTVIINAIFVNGLYWVLLDYKFDVGIYIFNTNK